MATPTTGCLSAAEMSDLVRRPLEDSQADKLACHLEQCTACACQAEAILNGDRTEAAMRETAGALDATQIPDARMSRCPWRCRNSAGTVCASP